jgi:hypothetical protein
VCKCAPQNLALWFQKFGGFVEVPVIFLYLGGWRGRRHSFPHCLLIRALHRITRTASLDPPPWCPSSFYTWAAGGPAPLIPYPTGT